MPAEIGVLVSLGVRLDEGVPTRPVLVMRPRGPCDCSGCGRGGDGGGGPRFLRPRGAGQWGDGLPPPSPCYGRSGSGRGNIQGGGHAPGGRRRRGGGGRPDAVTRAILYLARCAPAVQREDGSGACFRTACF